MEAPTGSGIELAVVRRFVDVAVDALADAREEIDALNVYPVPDGDTGTNMYLTMSAARDAIHEAVAPGARPGSRADRVPPGRTARRPRQQRRHPQPDPGRHRAPDRPRHLRGAQRHRDGRGHGRGHRGQLRRRRYAGRGHDPDRRPRRLRRRRTTCRPSRGRGLATSSRPPPRPRVRRSCTPPSSSGSCARPAWSTPAGAGCASILDAAESVLTGRRRIAWHHPLGVPTHPGDHGASPTSPRAARPTR